MIKADFPQFWGQKPWVRVSALLVSSDISCLGIQMVASSLQPLVVFPGYWGHTYTCSYVLVFFPYKDTSHVAVGPTLILITSLIALSANTVTF